MAQPNPYLRKRAPLKPTLERHPLSAVFGDMDAGELEELKNDIDANGLIEPIILYEGKVLDGWHRYLCLCALSRPLNTKNHFEYDPAQDGEDPEKFVYSKNLYRRQLSAEDRALMAAKVLGYEPTGRGGKPKEGATIKEVAALAQVSEKTALRAVGKSKQTNVRLPTEPTLESLQKRKVMLEGQLKSVNEKIAALSPAPVRRRR